MLTPEGPAAVDPIPHGRTSRRLDWRLLPPTVRALVEKRLGSPVAKAVSAGSGFTPGFASVLVGQNGATMFVKAASKVAQRTFAEAYTAEIRRLRLLPAGLPVPRLLWSHEDDLWVVLGLEYVAGTDPSRPWHGSELAACLDTLEVLAEALSPPPGRLPAFADDFADFPQGWKHVRAVAPDWPHLEEAAALAARFRRITSGTTMVHTDAHDNFLVRPDGRAVLGDWKWPTTGAAWIDTVSVLISAAGDGLDADALLASRRLTRDVDPDHVDVLLALFCGYFLERRDQPVPNSSPYLRRHQSWYAEASWAWLARRRSWTR
jgi:hypothetical protein